MTKPAKKPHALASTAPSRTIQVTQDPSKTEHQQFAEVSLSPLTHAAVTARGWAYKSMGEIGINEAIGVMKQHSEAAVTGDLVAAKAMLIAQATTLDIIFNEMAGKAAGVLKTKEDGSWSMSAETMDALMRVAFKAQGQCRATLQTLGELVNPRSVAFIKQANMANGPQQVNNGTAAKSSPAGKTEDAANKLLEANPSERLDIGAQAAPGGEDSVLEAVGTVHRAENGGRKVSRLSERRKARTA